MDVVALFRAAATAAVGIRFRLTDRSNKLCSSLVTGLMCADMLPCHNLKLSRKRE
jgi:hypothetical protein